MSSKFGYCGKCGEPWKIIYGCFEPSGPCCVCVNCGVDSKHRVMKRTKKLEKIAIKRYKEEMKRKLKYENSDPLRPLPRPSVIREYFNLNS